MLLTNTWYNSFVLDLTTTKIDRFINHPPKKKKKEKKRIIFRVSDFLAWHKSCKLSLKDINYVSWCVYRCFGVQWEMFGKGHSVSVGIWFPIFGGRQYRLKNFMFVHFSHVKYCLYTSGSLFVSRWFSLRFNNSMVVFCYGCFDFVKTQHATSFRHTYCRTPSVSNFRKVFDWVNCCLKQWGFRFLFSLREHSEFY